MGIFRNRQEASIDLSDESLLVAEMQTEPIADAAAESAEPTDTLVEAAQPAAETPEAPQASRAEQEQAWREAATDSARHWPQLMSDPRRLLAKMAEISARYGDSRLWQRAPSGIMREAAIELYGLPESVDGNAISGAIREAHAAGRRLAETRHQAKLGLAPPRGGSMAPPVVSEDVRIIREMMEARRSGIF